MQFAWSSCGKQKTLSPQIYPHELTGQAQRYKYRYSVQENKTLSAGALTLGLVCLPPVGASGSHLVLSSGQTQAF
jgi:hypothetical protein